MSDIAVSVEGLGKRYRIAAPARSLRAADRVARGRYAGSGRAAARARRRDERVDLGAPGRVVRVRRGDVVGVIGRNGAGKTTLLKVLSRITEPTTGRASSGPGRLAARGRHRLPPRADRAREHLPERRGARHEAGARSAESSTRSSSSPGSSSSSTRPSSATRAACRCVSGSRSPPISSPRS